MQGTKWNSRYAKAIDGNVWFWISILYLFSLGKSVQAGKGAMRLTLCEAPTRETRPDLYTGNSVPYCLRQVRGFFNVPCWLYNTEDAGDGAYDLSSLSEKTKTSNHLQMSLRRQHVLLVILRPWVLVRSGARTRDLPRSSPALYQLSQPTDRCDRWEKVQRSYGNHFSAIVAIAAIVVAAIATIAGKRFPYDR